MRKLLVFQHVPFEPLGTLDRQFKDAGFRIRYVNFFRQSEVRVKVGRYHGLIVLGGPMSADQTQRYPHLNFELESIRQAVNLNMPVLGICLGAQLIAACLGGRTLRGQAVEIGWSKVTPTDLGTQDPLFRHFRNKERIFQWHSDTFTLPSQAAHLARSSDCEHQAFCFGEHVYGLQFHLEADRALIRRWLSTPQHIREFENLGGVVDRERIVNETNQYIARATRLGQAVFGEFIERFYGWRRRTALPSR